MSPSITALILTYNEARHIERCIRSLDGLVERVCIVDSHSTDGTVALARALGAEVILHPWKGYARQFRHGLDSFDIRSDWTLRIDADEYLDSGLRAALARWFAAPRDEINALYLRRKIVFLDRPITHGFFYPALMLRLWRSGQGAIEQRAMDEHILVRDERAETVLGGDLVDHNLNDLGWWISKHIGYADREVRDMLRGERDAGLPARPVPSGQAGRKRRLKQKVYARLPAGLRAGLYFFYRYVLGAGFLDGRAGLYFHFLQAYWYRMLVDAKLYELRRRARAAGLSPLELLARDDDTR